MREVSLAHLRRAGSGERKLAVEKNASGTTQAAYANQGLSIYDPLLLDPSRPEH